MQSQFATFHDSTDKPVIVNPAQVRFFVPLSTGKTRIWFDKEHAIDVNESIVEVGEALSGRS